MILKSLENNKKAHLSLLWDRKMNDIRHFDILPVKIKILRHPPNKVIYKETWMITLTIVIEQDLFSFVKLLLLSLWIVLHKL